MDYATYSPDDDKLRLYAASRLSPEDYARVKGAGFQWAPKQGCFYAVWSPGREALLEDFTGSEIEDDDKTLTERAEERAERFEGYRENRARDAESARRAVSAIADNIPFGQPILVGHHSEKHARRDAERIENGMRRAVKMWKTSQYWTGRAAGALANAKYKERPDVRHRRIKGLESDLRKRERGKAESEAQIARWARMAALDGGLTFERARAVANYGHVSKCFTLAEFPRLTPEASTYEGMMDLWSALEGIITPEQAREISERVHRASIEHAELWIAHLTNRIAYERAMLAEAGGLGVDRAAIPVQVGGRVRVGKEWCTVLRLNYREGALVSVSTNRRYVRVVGIEAIAEVEAPKPGAAAAVKQAVKLAPLCNYPGDGFAVITRAEWDAKHADYKGSRVVDATATHAEHRVRSMMRAGGSGLVFISDLPTKYPPAAPLVEEPEPERIEAPAPDLAMYEAAMVRDLVPSHEKDAAAATFEAMAESLRGGVQVVSAPHLFPTPVHVAERMAELLDVKPDSCILEPSAGTGRLLDAIGIRTDWNVGVLVAVELNHGLVANLRAKYTAEAVRVDCEDFLSYKPVGKFDRIVMNPPFDNGADIRHVQHALSMLDAGGRLVAIVADGPRQAKAFADVWDDGEPLESGTFEGTGARARILVFDAEPAIEADGFELRA